MASIVGRIDIAVALVPSLLSIVIVLPTRRPLLLSCPRSTHRRRAPLSNTVESSHRPSSLPLRSRSLLPSITVKELSCRPLPLSCRHAVHGRGATSSNATIVIAVTVAPSIAGAPSIAVTASIAISAVDVTSHSRLPLPLPQPSCAAVARLFHSRTLVDCCLFTPPPLPLRLPLLSPLSALCHRRVVAGERIVVAIVIIIAPPPSCLPLPHPALVDCYIPVDSRELYR